MLVGQLVPTRNRQEFLDASDVAIPMRICPQEQGDFGQLAEIFYEAVFTETPTRRSQDHEYPTLEDKGVMHNQFGLSLQLNRAQPLLHPFPTHYPPPSKHSQLHTERPRNHSLHSSKAEEQVKSSRVTARTQTVSGAKENRPGFGSIKKVVVPTSRPRNKKEIKYTVQVIRQ